MVPYATVQAIMQGVATAINTTFIRGNQAGTRPPYPFFRYNITSDNIERPHQNSRSNALKEGDDTTIVRTRTEKCSATISITGVDKTDSETLRNLIDAARSWFLSDDAETLAETYGIVLRFPGQVQNRTPFIEPIYEYQMGFDIRVDGATIRTSEVEAMQQVTAGVTVNDEVQDDLIISI